MREPRKQRRRSSPLLLVTRAFRRLWYPAPPYQPHFVSSTKDVDRAIHGTTKVIKRGR